MDWSKLNIAVNGAAANGYTLDILKASFPTVLDERLQFIISNRFDSIEPKTLKVLSNDLGISRERVRQLQNLALSKLHRATLKFKIGG